MSKKRKKSAKKKNRNRAQSRSAKANRRQKRSDSLLPAVLPESEQKKIRSRAFANCRRAWTSVGKSEKELNDYCENDLKKYKEWENSKILPLQRKLNELERSCWKDVKLFYSIKETAAQYKFTMAQAYVLITNPEYQDYLTQDNMKTEPNFSFGSEDEFEEEEDYSEESDEFEGCDCEFCRAREKFTGTKEDASIFYSEIGEKIKKALKGVNSIEEARANLRKLFDGTDPVTFLPKEIADELFEEFIQFFIESGDYKTFVQSDSENFTNQRISQLYRSLVKELHPDRIAQQENHETSELLDRKKELWHKLQEAYQSYDLRLLQSIKLQLEIFIKKNTKQEVSISDLASVRHDLKSINSQKRKMIRKLKKGAAWGFSKLPEDQVDLITRKQLADFEEKEEAIKQEINDIKSSLSDIKRLAKEYHGAFPHLFERVKGYRKRWA